MDNSQTGHLAAAKHYLLNLHRFLGSGIDPTFSGCNIERVDCGTNTSSNLDWAAYITSNVASAYGLLRNQFTVAERQTIADQLLNGLAGEACENMLQKQVGKVAYAAGSMTLVGTATQFDSRWIGQRINVTPNTWRIVTAVTSPDQLTVDSPFSTTSTGEDLHLLNTWKPGACGFMWFLAHHNYQPYPLAAGTRMNLVGAIDATTTTLTVTRAQEILDVPGYISINKEWFQILQRTGNTLTVARGQLGTTAATHAHNAIVDWLRYPSYGKAGTNAVTTPGISNTNIVYFESEAHNLIWAKVWAMIAAGAALASDDLRATSLLEQGWNYFYDTFYYNSKTNWTGLTQGGSAYGLDRFLDWMTQLSFVSKNTFEPAIDITEGQWLTAALRYPIYRNLPAKPEAIAPVWDSGTSSIVPARRWKYLMTLNTLYPKHPDLPFANYYHRSQTNNYARTSLDDMEIPHIAVLYTSKTNPQSNWNTLPLYHFFSTRDHQRAQAPNLGYHHFASRTSWTDPEATLLWGYALTQPVDHLASYPVPGTIQIIKGDNYLLAASTNNFVGFGDPKAQNAVQIGATNNLPTSTMQTASGVYGGYGYPDRMKGSEKYVYWRVNNTSAYRTAANIARYFRYVVHLKGSQDYVITYDELTTTQANEKVLFQHYPTGAQTGSTAVTFALNGDTVEFTRGGKYKINTSVLLPQGKSTAQAGSEAWTVTINDGITTTSEFLAVHMPSTLARAMPATTLLRQLPPNWRGVQMAKSGPMESENTRIVILPRDGSVPSTTLQFTPENYADVADIVVAGFTPGRYEITLPGSRAATYVNVGQDGTLGFHSTYGPISVRQTTTPPLSGAAITPIQDAPSAYSDNVQVRTETSSSDRSRPMLVSLTPQYGVGRKQEFAVTYQHPKGSPDIRTIDVLLRTRTGTAQACYVRYQPNEDVFDLLDDDGKEWIGTVARGSKEPLGNTQCAIDLSRSSADRTGTILTVRFMLFFNSSRDEQLKVYSRAETLSGWASEWIQVGSWWPNASDRTLRLQCLRDKDEHRHCTTDQEEYEVLRSNGLTVMNDAAVLLATPSLAKTPTRLPLYRLYDIIGATQVWTTDDREYLRLAKLANQYIGEGIQGFLSDAPGDAGIDLERILAPTGRTSVRGYAQPATRLEETDPKKGPRIAAIRPAGSGYETALTAGQVTRLYGWDLLGDASVPTVLVDGKPAQVISTKPLLTITTPNEIVGRIASVQVITDCGNSTAMTMPVSQNSPVLLTDRESGRGTVLASQGPGGAVMDYIRPGDHVTVFVSGLKHAAQTEIGVWIGGREARLLDLMHLDELPGMSALTFEAPSDVRVASAISIRVRNAFTQEGAILRLGMEISSDDLRRGNLNLN